MTERSTRPGRCDPGRRGVGPCPYTEGLGRDQAAITSVASFQDAATLVANGRVGPGVTGLVVHMAGQSVRSTLIEGGWFVAWTPGPQGAVSTGLPGQGSRMDSRAWTYDATLADGREVRGVRFADVPNAAGARSTHPTWSPSSEPAPASTKASSSNETTTTTPGDQPAS